MRGDESATARSRQASRGSVGNPIDPNLAVQIDRILEPTLKKFSRIVEKVEVLNGDRQGARARTAMRRNDFGSLSDIGRQRSNKADGSTPSKEEFDRLVDDVKAIRDALSAIADAINR